MPIVDQEYETLLSKIRELKHHRVPTVVSKEEAAEKLGVSVRLLNREIAEGRVVVRPLLSGPGMGIPRSELARIKFVEE